MVNLIKMEMHRMFKMKCFYVLWTVLAVSILVTTNLNVSEWKSMTVAERQEIHEMATESINEEEELDFGMYIVNPTEPTKEISVFDTVFANIKGKFILLLMVIFTILYSTADISSGYIKNIAGQIRDRKSLIYAKSICLFFYTIFTMLFYIIVQMVSNKIWIGEIYWGNKKEFLIYMAIECVLHFAFLVIIMFIAILLRNNVFSMVLGVCMCMNILVMAYGIIDKVAYKFGFEKFHFINYTVTGRISLLGMEISQKAGGTALIIALIFIVASVMLAGIIFEKRDI